MSFPALFPGPDLSTFWCSCRAQHGIAGQMIDAPARGWSVYTEKRLGELQVRATVARAAPAQTVSEVARPAYSGKGG